MGGSHFFRHREACILPQNIRFGHNHLPFITTLTVGKTNLLPLPAKFQPTYRANVKLEIYEN